MQGRCRLWRQSDWVPHSTRGESPLQLIGLLFVCIDVSTIWRLHWVFYLKNKLVSFAVPASGGLSDTICSEHTQVSVRQSTYSPLSSASSPCVCHVTKHPDYLSVHSLLSPRTYSLLLPQLNHLTCQSICQNLLEGHTALKSHFHSSRAVMKGCRPWRTSRKVE